MFDIKLKVGDFVIAYGDWHEVLGVHVVSADRGLIRIAIPSADGSPIVTRTFNHNSDSGMFVTGESMAKTIASGNLFSYKVVTAADAINNMGKLNYGNINDYANIMLDSDYSYHRSGLMTWLCESKVISNVVRDYSFRHLAGIVYRPSKSKLKEGNISLFRNAADFKRDRETSMKPGRAFRHMFPSLSDKEIAEITESWLEETSPRALTLHTGKQAKDFRRAYDHDRASYRNPATTHARKSLATSCMQGVGRDYYVDGEWVYGSVGEAYASGDFKVAWLETATGEIAGVDVDAWSGFKFAAVGDSDDLIVPYIDGDLYGSLTPCGKFIRLDISHGEFTFDSTDGYTTGGETCVECGDNIEENDMCYTDEGPMCACCFDENYVVDVDGDTLHRDEAILVMCKNRWGQSEEWVQQDYAVFCEPIDQYWHIDDVTFTEDGDEAVPTHLIGDFPELFPSDDDDDDLEEAA